MSDPILSLTDPKRFFPRLWRVVQQIQKEAFRQWHKHGPQQAGAHTSADLFAWCADQWEGSQAVFHYLRIQRRLRHFTVMLSAKFTMSTLKVRPINYRFPWPGYYLIRGFKKHRMPK